MRYKKLIEKNPPQKYLIYIYTHNFIFITLFHLLPDTQKRNIEN